MCYIYFEKLYRKHPESEVKATINQILEQELPKLSSAVCSVKEFEKNLKDCLDRSTILSDRRVFCHILMKGTKRGLFTYLMDRELGMQQLGAFEEKFNKALALQGVLNFY